jgi:FtsP/CotA-like multicopper oxidase with cupredoxin domain
MMRMGLLTAGGSLVMKQGLSARWAWADQNNGVGLTLTEVQGIDGPPSPPIQHPFIQELPRLPVLPGFTDPNGFQKGGAPLPTTLIDGATTVYQHQLFTQFPPTKFYELHMQQTPVTLHPDYPDGSTIIWGFNGQAPGPLIRARYGESTLVRYYNELPSVQFPAVDGFGIAEIAPHLHNAHTPFESDGNPVDFVNSIKDPTKLNPFGFKDNHYPNVYAGFNAPKPVTPIGNPNEALGSLWYHDHHIDFTAQNVYEGMFGCYNLFDDLDTGNETTGLQLPSGDFDVPIFFNDFLLNNNHRLVFDLFDLDGILGDRFCANGAIQPKFTVSKRRYRLRLYNPGPSRWYQFALTDPTGRNFFPFWQISADGNLLPNAVKVTNVRLSVAERVDIVVDFSSHLFDSLTQLFLVNQLEQVNGRGPTGKILNPGIPIIQINMQPNTGGDPSNSQLAMTAQSPAVGMALRPLPDTDAQLAAAVAGARTRTFKFERGNGAWQINGRFFDETVAAANPGPGAEEVWIFQNSSGGWRHPIHTHFEEHRVLSSNGVPVVANTQVNGSIDYARRDVVPLNDNNEVRVFFRFRDLQGRYVMHCHNVVHEDHAMMIRYDIGKIPPPTV